MRFVSIMIMFLTASLCNAQAMPDDYALILRLLVTDYKLGYLKFGSEATPEHKLYMGLSENDRLLLMSWGTGLFVPGLHLIELDNPNQDNSAFNAYIKRLRDSGWKLYVGDGFNEQDNTLSDEERQGDLFLCQFEFGSSARTVRHLLDGFPGNLGDDLGIDTGSDRGTYKTYIAVIDGSGPTAQACWVEYTEHPEDFE